MVPEHIPKYTMVGYGFTMVRVLRGLGVAMPAGLCGLGRPCGRQDFNPERWIAPAGFSSTNISTYQEYVYKIAMRQRGWEGRTPFPCWRPIDCPPSLLARVIARQDAADGSEESCSAHLQRHKCYDMPPLWYIL